jgi:hypothetical protein
MTTTYRWLIQAESVNTLVEFSVPAPRGQVKVSINGTTDTYIMSQFGETGFFTLLPCGTRKCLLQVSLDGTTAALYVDDALQTPLSVSDGTAVPGQATAPVMSDSSLLQKKIKSGMGSFMTLILFSVVNMILIFAKATIEFPFSIFAVSFSTQLGQAFSESYANKAFIWVSVIVAIVIIAAYAVLYALASRHAWPVWLAFGLIIADTILMLVIVFVLTSFNMSVLIDLAFHGWIIWSLLQLGLSKQKLKQMILQPVPAAAAQTDAAIRPLDPSGH